MLKKWASAKSQQGSRIQLLGNIGEKIGKSRQTLKNTKYNQFFQNFKHIKQQQHQINTLEHKYGERTNIYHVVMPNIK